MRSTIEEIRIAHRFDPDRRELYVEGRRDRTFLTYLAGETLHPDAVIREIDSIDVPEPAEGGNRARLLTFADEVDGQSMNIAYFADLDLDALAPKPCPANGWLSDVRDLDGYLFNVACFDKLAALVLGQEQDELRALLADILEHGRLLGFLRFHSFEADLDLPFQRTELKRCAQIVDDSLEVDIERYIGMLLQNADISLARRSEVLEGARAAADRFEAIDTALVVHGKDALDLLDAALPRRDIEPSLRGTFERSMIEGHESLSSAIDYLTVA